MMSRTVRALLFALALLLAWSATFVLLGSPDRVRVRVGEPSPGNIRAPRRVVYISEVKTEEARNAAVARVEDVYSPPDMSIAVAQLQALEADLTDITTIREDSLADHEQKLRLLTQTPGLEVDEALLSYLLTMTTDEWEMIAAEAIRVLDLIMREDIREADVVARAQRAYRLASRELTPVQRDLMAGLVSGHVAANSLLDQEQTATLRQNARKAVEPVQWTIHAGESIVREGEIVSPLALEKLQVLGLLEDELRWQDVGGTVLLCLALVGVISAYVALRQPTLLDRPRRQLLLVLTLVIVAAAARLSLPGRVLMPYAFPAAAAAMLISALMNVDLATMVAAIVAALVGLNAGGSIDLSIYALVGGIVGAVAMSHVDEVETFVRGAAYVAVANVIVLLGFHLRNQILDTLGLVQLLGMAVTNGALSAALAFTVFALIGRVFGITTFMQLLELARPTHPLFRQLLIKAPGTYHHSIVVSNMAERAAEAIGADALLTRVGSYYHDIGKISRPYFFAENQTDGDNPHDHLDPETSADIIISHTREGLQLARRYGLPERVCAFIPEHHGTTLAGYFYRHASQGNAGKPVSEASYRYPGPRPQSKESAIVMLADSIEAAVRAKRPHTQAETRDLVTKIILDRLTSGELDESDLHMRDLDAIRSAFLEVLQGVFHPRIDYPETVPSAATSSSGASSS